MRKKERFVLGKRTFRSQKSKHFVLRIIHKSGLSKVDVSVTAQNLGYITAAKNMATPEYGVSQNGGYPLPRTVVLGLNVTF